MPTVERHPKFGYFLAPMIIAMVMIRRRFMKWGVFDRLRDRVDRHFFVMALGPKLSEEPYSAADLRLLSAVASQTGLGLEVNDLAETLAKEAAGKQRMQREMEIAREVQERLFPQHIPVIRGLDLAGHCRPALGVGGDYYDMMELEDGRLALAIGDVSGKGIGAALLMASLRASLLA